MLEEVGKEIKKTIQEEVLCQIFGVSRVIIERSDSGAPSLVGRNENLSISYCENNMILTISNKNVGVDFEIGSPSTSLDLFPNYILGPGEKEFFDKLETDDERREFVLRAWICKEAFFKCSDQQFRPKRFDSTHNIAPFKFSPIGQEKVLIFNYLKYMVAVCILN